MIRSALACALALFALLLPATSFAQGRTIVIYAGRLIDGTGAAPQNRVSIVIRDGIIVAIEHGLSHLANADVIDLSDRTVLPGLIDTHVHFAYGDYPGDAVRTLFVRDDFDDAIAATRYARDTLLAGFTTVRDVGAPNARTTLALKSAIESGIVPGPRMFVAGAFLGPTGGHGDQASGLREGVDSLPGWKDGIVDSPEAGRRAVRLMHRMGADLIKIMPSGGVLSVGDDPQALLMTDEEISAIVTTAHSLGMKVAAHAHGRDAILHAVSLGVDSIEHGTFGDAATDALMRKRGIFLVPTLLVAEKVLERARDNGATMAPSTAAKALTVAPLISANLARAYRDGVRIAFGTDASTPAVHGTNAQEFALMVKAGMSPMDAILAATRNAADLLGQSGTLGRIAAGARADVMAVRGDPLADIRTLEDADFVMKAGKVVKRDGRPS